MIRDWRHLHTADLGVLAFGLFAFLASFVVISGASGDSDGIHFIAAPNNAWHGTALVGVILVIVATVLAAVLTLQLAALPAIGVPWRLIVLGLCALGLLLVIIRSFTLPGAPPGTGADEGLLWGGWLLIIVCALQTACAALGMRASGEAMPWHHQGAGVAPPPPTTATFQQPPTTGTDPNLPPPPSGPSGTA